MTPSRRPLSETTERLHSIEPSANEASVICLRFAPGGTLDPEALRAALGVAGDQRVLLVSAETSLLSGGSEALARALAMNPEVAFSYGLVAMGEQDVANPFAWTPGARVVAPVLTSVETVSKALEALSGEGADLDALLGRITVGGVGANSQRLVARRT